MNETRQNARPTVAPLGLSAISRVELTEDRQRRLEAASRFLNKNQPWGARKEVELRELLALSQLAEHRLQIGPVGVTADLTAEVLLNVPVPLLHPDRPEGFVVTRGAVLGLIYPEQVMSQRLPGIAFVQLLQPRGPVWHPNVSYRHGILPDGLVCLGADLPIGVRAIELLLLAYAALAMQTVTLDPRDSAGVLNYDAAIWWQQRTDRLPLSRANFLDAEPEPAVGAP